ncbi:50S ribosomal protein L15e [Candidatus Woesearchaeota archaeon]|nr:MAG: 50S ribosomal protein L15e [Candidatus Woesearchaeota archaeon]
MGVYKYLQQIWKKQPSDLKKQRLIALRREPATVRVEKPTKLARARALGYKAKQGIIVVRQRVSRGGHKRPKIWGGRRSKNQGKRLNLRKNYQLIAEERASKSYKNCEVLNSYYLTEDGKHYWFEVILLDRASPSVLKDSGLNWIGQSQHRGRAHRGLTSAGRKMRGLRAKGKGAEKARPSRRANSRKL